MQDALLLRRPDLETVLDALSVLRVLEDAFHAERGQLWNTPKRIAAHAASGGLLAMPCAGGAPEALGAKLASTFPGNRSLGLPSVAGLFVLFDPGTGVPLSVMDAASLTLIRTASVSALATRHLARPDARTLGILGAGAQAASHARLIAAVRPIDSVMIWARQAAQARTLVDVLRASDELRHVTQWTVCDSARSAAENDVVVTATGSSVPVLEGSWLRPGAHVNCIGAHTRTTREIDADAVFRASMLVVETPDTLLEAGDFQMAEAEIGGVLERVSTLGAVIDPKRAPHPRDPEAISIFKSCGVAFEDLAVASLAFSRARDLGLGVRFSFA